nr:RNA-directed DNA polymerase, eukaryota, nucleotide-binding alpha-beta plait domain protein [Tanacetum cinerariifolium]
MGFHNQKSLHSKYNQTSKISKSIFIYNLPPDCSNRDLWNVCNDYGTVVDVFIPNKKSKSGKRFAFVRFIKVPNLDRLVENLNTIWMGCFHLLANSARYERSQALSTHKEKTVPAVQAPVVRQPNIQNLGGSKVVTSNTPYLLKLTLVLDDSCLVVRDLENSVIGEVLQLSSLNNLQVLLANEGFHYSRVVYLGGLWVLIELKSSKSESKFLQHVGVASWFKRLCNAEPDFAAKERIVWVDIEGVPLNAWSRNTFQKIGSKWGEMVELEDGYDDLFVRKRICIKTSQSENILESFKLIVKGKVYWFRAKELFVWAPSFKDVPEIEVSLDEESVKANDETNCINNEEEESDSEVVLDTYFGDNAVDQDIEQNQGGSTMSKEVSADPFNIYDLIDKRAKEAKPFEKESSIPFPPGSMPVNDTQSNFMHVDSGVNHNCSSVKSVISNSRILVDVENSVDRVDRVSSENTNNEVKLKEGGSILELLEEMITVGQTMGFSMDGCTKDMEKIIGFQREHTVF